jgi:RimJ/RimL family protein N-acetyltransferase
MGSQQRLETERLVLRPLTRGDLGAYERIGAEQAEREVGEAEAHWAEHGFGPYAICDRETGALIGALEIHFAGDGIGGIEPDEVEIGWAVAAYRRGAGIATEAARAAVDHTFATLAPDHVVAYIRLANSASFRVAAKLGMRDEGEGTTRSGNPMRIFRLPRPTTIEGP